MTVKENFSLRKLNTFGIEAIAKYFAEVSSMEEIRELLSTNEFQNTTKFILGGGSNILFTRNFDGIIVKNNLKGIHLLKEDEEFYYVKAGAGENWHQFVLYCIEHNYAGIENLSLIPGNIGASPMQNIGAYGTEIKDVFVELEAINIHTGEKDNFSNKDCRFGYRESIFKLELKNKYIITSVTYRLRKTPVFNISYGAIEQELEKMGVKELSIAEIGRAVCNIRSSKLPDPAIIGNAGSFFKNPVISKETYSILLKKYADIPAYQQPDGTVKLAAGWLIEKCGWKGSRFGDAGVHKNQALVLVNYGEAPGHEIYELSTKILKSVKETFGIQLEREVNIL